MLLVAVSRDLTAGGCAGASGCPHVACQARLCTHQACSPGLSGHLQAGRRMQSCAQGRCSHLHPSVRSVICLSSSGLKDQWYTAVTFWGRGVAHVHNCAWAL